MSPTRRLSPVDQGHLPRPIRPPGSPRSSPSPLPASPRVPLVSSEGTPKDRTGVEPAPLLPDPPRLWSVPEHLCAPHRLQSLAGELAPLKDAWTATAPSAVTGPGRLELRATDMLSWPPSAIRKHFTAAYRETRARSSTRPASKAPPANRQSTSSCMCHGCPDGAGGGHHHDSRLRARRPTRPHPDHYG